MKADIIELSEKYRLPEWAVREEVEKALSEILTHRLGFEVEALLRNRGDTLELWGVIPRCGDIEVRRISPESVRKTLEREIKHKIALALLKQGVINHHEQLKVLIGTMVYGSISRIQPSGSLDVELQGPAGESLTAVCDPASQTPKERGNYRRGEVLPFAVKSVQPLLINGIPRLEISLSRNSKGLVEGLLREELKNMGCEAEIRCTKRTAGAFSEIRASKRIPRECVKHVSDTLRERILVTY